MSTETVFGLASWGTAGVAGCGWAGGVRSTEWQPATARSKDVNPQRAAVAGENRRPQTTPSTLPEI